MSKKNKFESNPTNRHNKTKNNPFSKSKKSHEKKQSEFSPREKNKSEKIISSEEQLIRLNKYIANAGICSRREADVLIETGAVKVNGQVITSLGYKIKNTDNVEVEGHTIKNERKVYLLLNKPKDYITTTDDPQNRKTVMELVKGACKERIFPVGRLDRQTTGILLFTNDGELANKLMHPKSRIAKLYHIVLNKNFSGKDFEKLSNGIQLEDGLIKPDALSYAMNKKNELGIQIHSGQNRIIRKIFEQLGYDIKKLDRAIYAGLTKKNLPRGKWRFLTEKEIAYLKMI